MSASTSLEEVGLVVRLLNAVSHRQLSRHDYRFGAEPALGFLRPGALPRIERVKLFARAVGMSNSLNPAHQKSALKVALLVQESLRKSQWCI